MADETVTPQFTHDCTACTFLGRFAGEFGDYDLYHCEQGTRFPTVIARYSSHGPDYRSGLAAASAGYDSMLGEALKRAKERGLRCE